MLTEDSVLAYLIDRAILPPDQPASAWPLAGGVSNIVLAVDCGDQALVVKQSLPQLRVETVWKAKQERTLNEARALSLAGAMTPDRVPELIDVDDTNFVLVISRAPCNWTEWKRLLLAGEIDPAVAGVLGGVLGSWHAGTSSDRVVMASLDDPEAFDQLRVGPYYRTVAEKIPEFATQIGAVVNRMTSTRSCLVHGDYSPKNILVGATSVWVVDFEVAHLGDPVFDVAFMLSHLILKSLHMPERSAALQQAGREFLAGYHAQTGAALDWNYLAEQVGCLLLARVAGQSPVEYLDDRGRQAAERAGRDLLQQRSLELTQLLALTKETS